MERGINLSSGLPAFSLWRRKTDLNFNRNAISAWELRLAEPIQMQIPFGVMTLGTHWKGHSVSCCCYELNKGGYLKLKCHIKHKVNLWVINHYLIGLLHLKQENKILNLAVKLFLFFYLEINKKSVNIHFVTRELISRIFGCAAIGRHSGNVSNTIINLPEDDFTYS